MNYIYCCIWSIVKQCWVVGSELSVLCGKLYGGGVCLLGNCVVLVVCFFFLLLVQVMEFVYCEFEQIECLLEVVVMNIVCMNLLFKVIDDFFCVGFLVVGEMFWGDGIKCNGDYNIVFGYCVEVIGGYNIVVGLNVCVYGLGLMVLGNNFWVSGVNSVVVGSGVQVIINGGVGVIVVGVDVCVGMSGFMGVVLIGNQVVV